MKSELVTILEQEAAAEIARVLAEAHREAEQLLADARREAAEHLEAQRQRLDVQRRAAMTRVPRDRSL